MGARANLATEAPCGERDRAEPAGVDGLVSHLHRLGIAMVEVDGEEEVARCSLVEQPVGLRGVEQSGFSTKSG